MKLALVGGSCVGKTSVMRKIAELVLCQTRSCGSEVFAAAKRMDIQPNLLPLSNHIEIDNATRDFVNENFDLVVDGRFLDTVLNRYKSLFIVKLTASDVVRAQRATSRKRDETETEIDFINNSDINDSLFRNLMYKDVQPAYADLIIDTDHLSIEQVVEKILYAVNQKI